MYWRLSGLDNLRYFASLYGINPDVSKQRIPYLLELAGLKGREKARVEEHSRGMKQRLHVARTLLHDPPVLFLDEPTIGLDPVGARDFRQVIRTLRNDKKTILLITHHMYEADLLCERIAVINHGKIIAFDTPTRLKQLVSNLSVVEIELFGVPDEALNAVNVERWFGTLETLVGAPLLYRSFPLAAACNLPRFKDRHAVGADVFLCVSWNLRLGDAAGELFRDRERDVDGRH